MSQDVPCEDLCKDGVIALGANLPLGQQSPEMTLCKAVMQLCDADFSLLGLSRFYRSPAWPPGSGPDYVNAVARFRSPLSAKALLARLHQVEATLGRLRAGRWGPRVIDLDLVYLGQELAPDLAGWRHWQGLAPEDQSRLAPDQLILPHPRLAERAFVLVPLAELAPDWRHPVTGDSVLAMRDALPAADRAALLPFSAADPAQNPRDAGQ